MHYIIQKKDRTYRVLKMHTFVDLKSQGKAGQSKFQDLLIGLRTQQFCMESFEIWIVLSDNSFHECLKNLVVFNENS